MDFIIDTASGDHPFDPFISLLKTSGVLVLVGAQSEVKFSAVALLRGNLTISDLKFVFLIVTNSCSLGG